LKRLSELLHGLVEPERIPAVMIAGLKLDSRRIEPGDAFVALAGGTEHGIEHAGAALGRGAAVVLHDAQARPGAELAERCIEVQDLDAHLAALARRFHDDPASAVELLAVTGTNGKTSVAWLLAQALDAAVIGTLGIGRPGALLPATHTTPDILSLYRALATLRDTGHRTAVLEASSHALDQRRLAGLEFTSTVFTNLGRDHLDYHGSLEAYGEAKARLFTDYRSTRQLINADDPFGLALADRLQHSPGLLRYGLSTEHRPEVLGTIRSADAAGLQLDVNTPVGRVCLRSGLIGRCNASNLVIVAAELTARGMAPADVAEIVAGLNSVPGRMNRIDGPAGQCVVIDYAHSPDALENALVTLRDLGPERLICVFGCGGERDRGKRPLMGRIAEALADRVILTDDNPRREDPLRILREIQSGMTRPDRVVVISDRKRAIRSAIAEAGPRDCVLIAGKGHERTQDFGDRQIEFSDFDAARGALTEAA